MRKHYLTDARDSGMPLHAKSARINRLSSPSSGAVALSGKDEKQIEAASKAAEVMARYDAVNVLFSSQFPDIDIRGASHPARATSPSSPPSGLGGSSYYDFGVPGGDGYDRDLEFAFEINASMGLVRHVPTRPQPDAISVVPTYPWLANGCISAGVPMTPTHTTHDIYTGSGDMGWDDSSTQGLSLGQSPPAQSYPFTSPTAGELMVTASPSDAMLYTQSPSISSRTGDVVKDLEWLGESLQRNTKIQLQKLSEGRTNVPYVT